MSRPQVIDDQEHERVHERVAAIDVAKDTGMVCTRTPHPSRPGARRSTVRTARAPTGAEQPASSAASRPRSAVTAASRRCRSSSDSTGAAREPDGDVAARASPPNRCGSSPYALIRDA